MREFIVDPELERDPELARAIERTRPMLDGILGTSAEGASARWMKRTAVGRPFVLLNLSDWTHRSGVEALLTPEDLQDERYLQRRLHDLWGDLLQAHLKGIVERLNAMELDGATP